ncbi:hypothetical protein JD844_015393, partial [Phrynosoma platyrhinos]
MSILWTGMLALALLSRHGVAQSCKTNLKGLGRNLAKGRPAFQSSISSILNCCVASKAVDGNCKGEYLRKSCTHTGKDLEPWWYVDLGNQYAISFVVVKNREDCCGCGTITDTRLGSISTISCNGLKGRYVSIISPNQFQHFSICEVEVMSILWTGMLVLALLSGHGAAQSCKTKLKGLGRNLAKGRPAFQSSIFKSLNCCMASNAVDGNCDGDWWKMSCIYTKFDLEPWWYVDLGNQYAISFVVVKNLPNLAKGRLAFQSSTYEYTKNLAADKAVDGNCNGDLDHVGSCTYTNGNLEPW